MAQISSDTNNRRLASLCILSAAGVAGLGIERADGAIIVTNVNTSVGFAAGDSVEADLTLAGGHIAGVFTTTFAGVSHSLVFGATSGASFKVKSQQRAGYAFASVLNAGVKFGSAAGGTVAGGYIEYVSSGGVKQGPAAFTNKYFAFSFVNAGQTDYGWLEGSLTSTTYAGLTYKLTAYAYDDSGANRNGADCLGS